MPDQLFTQYIVSPLVTLSVIHGDWGNNGCLGRERKGKKMERDEKEKIEVEKVRWAIEG
jgi:hypothetical protein